jgi:hypothetical protein
MSSEFILTRKGLIRNTLETLGRIVEVAGTSVVPWDKYAGFTDEEIVKVRDHLEEVLEIIESRKTATNEAFSIVNDYNNDLDPRPAREFLSNLKEEGTRPEVIDLIEVKFWCPYCKNYLVETEYFHDRDHHWNNEEPDGIKSNCRREFLTILHQNQRKKRN